MSLGKGKAPADKPGMPRDPLIGLGGVFLVGLGVLMLLFSGMDQLRARPAYVSSTPEAGAQMTSTPRAIRVSFDHPLQSASTLSIVYVPVEPGPDDISRDVPVISRLASTDANRQTLEVDPPELRRGLYLVRWVAYPKSGGITRHGSFTFGVGVRVPPDERGMSHSLNERDSNARGRRSALLGGVLLLVIGALMCMKKD